MAILEEEVWILVGRSMKYYNNLEYEIPRILDKQGRMSTPEGSKILVKVSDLIVNSQTILTKICDVCGAEVSQAYRTILRLRESGNGKDRCYTCGNKERLERIQQKSIEYEKSLEYNSKVTNCEYLLQEFNDTNIKKPDQVYWGSSQFYLWNCPKCKSTYDMSMYERRQSNCPFCRGLRVNETNCLLTIYPDIAKDWHPDLNGDLTSSQVSKNSGLDIWWLCPICENSYFAKVNERTLQNGNGSGCPKCSMSKGETIINKYLMDKNIKFCSEYKFEDCKDKRSLPFDFVILDSKDDVSFIIEYDGEHHFKPVRFGGISDKRASDSFKSMQKRDKIKNQYCMDKNILLYRISYIDFDRIEEVLDSYF